MAFDPLNLLLLAVALIVFWRLRSVLGSRTGSERPPLDPYGPNGKGEGAAETDGTVIRFPQPAQGQPENPEEDHEEALPVWTGYAEEGSNLAADMESIAKVDPGFNPRQFLEGAKLAYEMVIDGFARGDKASLKNLLAREVFEGFSKAIDARETAGERMESRFVGINTATITDADLSGKRVAITVQFVSELISATLGSSDEVIEGDPRQIREVTDVWTFERDVSSRDPNWKLSATQAQV